MAMYLTKYITPLMRGTFVAILATALLLASPIVAAQSNGFELAPGPYSKLDRLCVQTQTTGWSVRGQLQLLDNPLRHSNPGRLMLQAVAADGQILAASDATIYRIVTASPRARLFGFRGDLSDGFPTGTTLRVQHLPAGP